MTEYPLSASQRSYITVLLGQRTFSSEQEVAWRAMVIREMEAGMTSSRASRWIDWLLSLPSDWGAVTTTAAPPAPADLGYYVDSQTQDVLVVVASKDNPDRRYAKRLVLRPGRNARWVYAHRAVFDIAGGSGVYKRLSIAEAAQLGRQHGVCVVCGHILTDPVSVADGIGPVCKTRL